MNNVYRIIWNEVLGAWVAVSERTKAKGKSARAKRPLAKLGRVFLFGVAGTTAGATLAVDNPIHMIGGAALPLDGISFATRSNDAIAVWADDGAGIFLNAHWDNAATGKSSSVTTAGNRSVALQAAGGKNPSFVVGSRVAVSTAGTAAHGAFVSTGGGISLLDSTIATTGGYAHGIYGKGNGTHLAIDGGSISTVGIGASSVSLYDGASAILTGTKVSAENSYALDLADDVRARLNQVNIVQGGPLAAVQVRARSTFEMNGGSIVKTGQDHAVTFFAAGSGTSTTMAVGQLTGAQITTAGDHSYGVNIHKNANVTFDGVTVHTMGDGARGLNIWDAASSMTLNNSHIQTDGKSAVGVVNFGGRIDFTGGTVTTNGASAHGVYAQDSMDYSTGKMMHAVMSVKDADIVVNGQAHGAYAGSGAELNISGGSIVTNGPSGAGVFAGSGATLNIAASNITANGAAGVAAYASAATLSVADDTLLIASANGGRGAVATGAGTQLFISGSAINTSGAASVGVDSRNDAITRLTATTVNGDAGDALRIGASMDGINNNSVTVVGGALNVQSGNALAVAGGSANISLKGVALQAPDGNVIRVKDALIAKPDGSVATIAMGVANINAIGSNFKSGNVVVDSGTLNLSLDNSSLNGDVFVNPSVAQANVSLLNAASMTGATHGVGSVNIDDSSQWTLSGSSTVTDTLTNAGRINFGVNPNAGFKALTTHNYVGNNGKITINTRLGDDKSPTDKLIIDGGHASGHTALLVNNMGGAGAQTNSGIMVVQAVNGGTSTADAFKLGRIVRAGGYDYFLFKGNASSAQADNWYLRSTLDEIPVDPNTPKPVDPPVKPGEPEPELKPVDPSNPEPEIKPEIKPDRGQLYGPERSVYSTVMPTAMRLGQVTLGTLHGRVGEQENLRADGVTQDPFVNGAWGRVIAQDSREKYTNQVGSSASTNISGFQAGTDVYRRQDAAGSRDHAGVYFGVAHADSYVSGLAINASLNPTGNVRQRTGAVKLDGWSGGAYWTHYGPSGWYVDTVLQATAYRGNASTDNTGIKIKGSGLLMSIEGGYPIDLGNFWSLEPQAQLMWQGVSLDRTADIASEVRFGSSNTLLGRIGARLQHTGKDGGRLFQPYLHANLWSNLSGAKNTVTYGEDGTAGGIETKSGTSWGQVGIGMTAQMTQNTSIYARLDGMFSIGGQGREYNGIGGSLGLRLKF
ncbi:autotransporter [Collimonas arenae]|uniref:Autotransporter n=1 Tax=Collimonas arenae TaxID=279058 RepID=A0A0A1FA70_9BURK|nr:autotransporter outer membrane beta-barrel domain-containing protein [Collimonas arenae]AIY41421.1 autotransporter [Collimonas arenae]